MGVVRGGPRAQNVRMFNTARWESHVLLPDVDCGVLRQNSARAAGDCEDEETSSTIVDMNARVRIVRTNCKAERVFSPSPVPAVVCSQTRVLNNLCDVSSIMSTAAVSRPVLLGIKSVRGVGPQHRGRRDALPEARPSPRSYCAVCRL